MFCALCHWKNRYFMKMKGLKHHLSWFYGQWTILPEWWKKLKFHEGLVPEGLSITQPRRTREKETSGTQSCDNVCVLHGLDLFVAYNSNGSCIVFLVAKFRWLALFIFGPGRTCVKSGWWLMTHNSVSRHRNAHPEWEFSKYRTVRSVGFKGATCCWLHSFKMFAACQWVKLIVTGHDFKGTFFVSKTWGSPTHLVFLWHFRLQNTQQQT